MKKLNKVIQFEKWWNNNKPHYWTVDDDDGLRAWCESAFYDGWNSRLFTLPIDPETEAIIDKLVAQRIKEKKNVRK